MRSLLQYLSVMWQKSVKVLSKDHDRNQEGNDNFGRRLVNLVGFMVCWCPAQVAYDFSLSNAIVPVDRDGDRRWASMVMKRRAAEAEGKEFPDAAVVTGEYLWANLRLAEKAYSLESLRIFAWVYI